MNAARVGREFKEAFPIENDILTPRQQVRLHIRCLGREHQLGKLAFHLKGIRRALFPPKCLTEMLSPEHIQEAHSSTVAFRAATERPWLNGTEMALSEQALSPASTAFSKVGVGLCH